MNLAGHPSDADAPPDVKEPAVAISSSDVSWSGRACRGLVLIALGFAPLATGAVRGQDFFFIQALAAALLILWGIRRFQAAAPLHPLAALDWIVGGFVGFALLRYAAADIEYVARQEVIKVVVYAAFFLVIRDTFRSPGTIRRHLDVLLILGAIISCSAIYQWMAGSDRVWTFQRPEVYSGRGSGTYISPDHFAGWLGLLLPVGLVRMSGAWRPGGWRVAMGIPVLLMVAGLVSSRSLGGLLAGGIGTMAFCIHLHTRKTSWKPLAAYYGMTLLLFACFVQVATAPSSVSSPVVDRRSEESATTLGDYSELRRLIWEPALAMWLDHPWCGVGPAHFDYRFREYRAGTIQARPDRVHNDLLNALADWGLAGTGLLLAGIALGFRSGLRSLRTDATWHLCGVGADRSTGGLVFGLVVGSAVLLMHSLVDFNLHIPGNALLCVTFLAWICNLDPNRSRVRSRRLLLWGSRAAGMVAGTFAVVMVLLLGRWAAEQRWLAGAEQAGASVPEQESALRGAFLVEPGNFETAGRLGEILRLRGWVGGEDYRLLTGEAMLWFERAMELNPHDPHSRLRYGMCLHWLERHEEAGQHFEEGLQLDPHGYYANALMGWHFLQLGDWVESERWFQRSLELLPAPQNAIAPAYLAILQQVRNRPEFTPGR